jgi:isorenieratene synthase
MEILKAFSKENIKTFGLFPHPQEPEIIKPINPQDKEKLEKKNKKSVLIIGAGLAGLSASLELAEKGFSVTLYEKNAVIGGKLKTPKLKTNQGYFHVEHGLHMWFYHYHTCKDIMDRIGVRKFFRPYRRVSVAFREYKQEIIRSVPAWYPINLIGILLRSPNLSLYDMRYLIEIIPDLMYFRYEDIYDRLDNISYHEWADRHGVSKKLFAILFEPAASVTINDPETISAAELVMWTHYFFIGHPKSMWREIAIDHHARTLLDPWLDYLKKYDFKVFLDKAVSGLRFEDNKAVGIVDDNKYYDWVVLACDVKAAQKILDNSVSNDDKSKKVKNIISKKLNELKIAPSYRIMRAWFDKRLNSDRPDILETPQFRPLHLLAQFHLLENESKKWAEKTGGSIIEFHFYADEEIASLPRNKLWDYVRPIILNVLPELKDANLIDFTLGTYTNFTSFDIGQGRIRPSSKFPIEIGCKNMLFAGDWVNTDVPSALMERATVTGRIAANYILQKEKVKQVPTIKCSNRGPGLF